jgi:hypothetical protein
MMPKVGSGRALRGNREPEKWQPYKLWMADLWSCPECGFEIICGTGASPISEHYSPDFAGEIEAVSREGKLKVKVNDC